MHTIDLGLITSLKTNIKINTQIYYIKLILRKEITFPMIFVSQFMRLNCSISILFQKIASSSILTKDGDLKVLTGVIRAAFGLNKTLILVQ